MINHATRIENLVKDEIAKLCAANGIDKNEVGYAIGGFGDMGIMMTREGPQMAAHWSVMISLRNLLMGQGPVGASVPVPGVLPDDRMFRAIVNELLPQVAAQ